MANLMGHDSHGIGMVPRYVDALLEGGLKVNQHPRISFDGGAMKQLVVADNRVVKVDADQHESEYEENQVFGLSSHRDDRQ